MKRQSEEEDERKEKQTGEREEVGRRRREEKKSDEEEDKKNPRSVTIIATTYDTAKRTYKTAASNNYRETEERQLGEQRNVTEITNTRTKLRCKYTK